MPVPFTPPDHYQALGLDRSATADQIRQAYRSLSRRHHPDKNGASAESVARTQALNEAHAVLRDPARRRAYDEECLIAADSAAAAAPPPPPPPGRRSAARNLAHSARLKLEEFLRGTTLTLHVNDPAHPEGPESFTVHVPPGTAPKTRLKIPRHGAMAGGQLTLQLLLHPHPRFKTRGSDLRCDLRINARRATSGGQERVTGPDGGPLHLNLPAQIPSGEIIRLPGHGLPKPRGGRGDLLVRVLYRPEITVHHRPAATRPENPADPQPAAPALTEKHSR